MARLPPELLALIADSVEQDPLPLDRQQTLSALARTNTTLHEICNTRIYRHPFLNDGMNAMKWGKVYARLVNPWSICAGTQRLEDVVVPESITFHYCLPEEKGDDSEEEENVVHTVSVNKRLEEPLNVCLGLELEMSPFFLRHLTSFATLESEHPTQPDFAALLFGPNGVNRATIKELSLVNSIRWPFVPFLLVALDRMEWIAEIKYTPSLLDSFPHDSLSIKARSALISFLEGDEDVLDYDDEDEIYDTVRDLASTHWSMYACHGAESTDADEVLAEILSNPPLNSLWHPFTSLENLTIRIRFAFELYLIFHSCLFPSLRRLKVIGKIGTCDDANYDVKFFRHSITNGPLSEYVPQAGMMSFAPINQIHQHLVGLHTYSTDRSRAVPSHHFCSCAPKHEKGTVRQCIIYDSDKADARLIGIEYVIEEAIFDTLDKEEQKFWHSHKHEVESGMLCLRSKNFVPTMVEDQAEQGAMKELHRTYGKTIHTWAIDSSPALPLGPPNLMMSFTADNQVSDSVISRLEQTQGIDLAHKRELRSKYLDTGYEKHEGADQWEKTGKGIELATKEVEFKEPEKGGAVWKGKESFEDVNGGVAQKEVKA
ncbi:OBAP family protein [Sporobolomyces salmoneus]|uniref:OBAP family protein n=1 Tax=Sporobolomyces salmoneus TaxID=183962 RepID=UPI00317563A6